MNTIVYLGKDEARPATLRLSENAVLKIVEPYSGKGRNVTTDNFLHLATQLRRPMTVFYNILDLACINAYGLYKKKSRGAISRINFMFQLTTELREALVYGKAAPLAAVLLSLLNDSLHNLIVDESRKQKRCQFNINCKQNKIAKFFCECRGSVYGK